MENLISFTVAHLQHSRQIKMNCRVGFVKGAERFKFILSPENISKNDKPTALSDPAKKRQLILMSHFLGGNLNHDNLCANIKNELETEGCEIELNIQNENFMGSVEVKIIDSVCVLICLTNKFLESQYGKFVIDNALYLKRRVIYIIIEDIDNSKLPETFWQTESINFTGEMQLSMPGLLEKLLDYKSENAASQGTCDPSLNPRSMI
jgi:hypothetical protein